MQYVAITGGTHGIGKATALRFLNDGYSVAICARNKEELDGLKQEWTEKFPSQTIITAATDLTQKTEIEAFANTVAETFERVDVLVNNAAYFEPSKLTEEDDGYLEEIMKLNVYAPYYLTRALLPTMKNGHGGHIFNISSVAGKNPKIETGSYGISKYAMSGFSENLRLELADRNIKVTTIYPSATYTRSWAGSGIDPNDIMPPDDVAMMIEACTKLSGRTVIEQITMRPAKEI